MTWDSFPLRWCYWFQSFMCRLWCEGLRGTRKYCCTRSQKATLFLVPRAPYGHSRRFYDEEEKISDASLTSVIVVQAGGLTVDLVLS